MANDTRRFIQNVEPLEAVAVKENYSRLKDLAGFGKTFPEGQIKPANCVVEKNLLFPKGELLYSRKTKCLGLRLNGVDYGFDKEHGERIDKLYRTISDFITEFRKPQSIDDFTTDF